MTQLYAEIRSSSKYASQVDWQKSIGGPYPFPVRIQRALDGYVVSGGPGGCYRLADVHLLVIHEDGTQTRIS